MPVQPFIPPDWTWVYDLVVGQDWPQANEDSLRNCAKAWTDAHGQLASIAQDGDVAAQNVGSSVQSASSDQFAAYWKQYIIAVRQLSDQSDGLAKQLAQFADQTEFTKLSIDVQIVILVIQLIIDAATAIITAGGSTAEGIAAAFLTRLTIRGMLEQLLRAVLAAVLPDVITQTIMLAQGHRSSYDIGETLQAAQMGVIGGAIGIGLGALGNKVGLTQALTKNGVLGGLLNAGIHGAVTADLTNAATGLADAGEQALFDPGAQQAYGMAQEKSSQNPFLAALNGAFTGMLFHGVHETGTALGGGNHFEPTPFTLDNGQSFNAVQIRDGTGSNYALFDENMKLVGTGSLDQGGGLSVTPNDGDPFSAQVTNLPPQHAPGSDQPLALGGGNGNDGTTPPGPSDDPTHLAGADQQPANPVAPELQPQAQPEVPAAALGHEPGSTGIPPETPSPQMVFQPETQAVEPTAPLPDQAPFGSSQVPAGETPTTPPASAPFSASPGVPVGGTPDVPYSAPPGTEGTGVPGRAPGTFGAEPTTVPGPTIAGLTVTGTAPETPGATQLASYGPVMQEPELADLQQPTAKPASPGAPGTAAASEHGEIPGQRSAALSPEQLDNITGTPTQLLSWGSPRVFTDATEAKAYAEGIWGPAFDQLSPQRQEALRAYTDETIASHDPPSYQAINEFLRGRIPARPAILDSIAQIDEALRLQPVPEDVVVNRTTNSRAFLGPDGRPIENPEDLQSLVGSVHESPRYQSAHFGVYHSGGEEVALHLMVPDGTPALYLGENSYNPTENELLLGRGLAFQVDRVWSDGQTWHVQAHVLEDAMQTGEPGLAVVPDDEHGLRLPGVEFTRRMGTYADQPTQPLVDFRGLTPDEIVEREPVTGPGFGSGSAHAQAIGEVSARLPGPDRSASSMALGSSALAGETAHAGWQANGPDQPVSANEQATTGRPTALEEETDRKSGPSVLDALKVELVDDGEAASGSAHGPAGPRSEPGSAPATISAAPASQRPVSAEELRAAAHPYEGGACIAGPQDPVMQGNMQRIRVDGAFVLEGHGAGGDLFAEGRPINFESAALPEQLRGLGWDGKSPIVLAACEGQAGDAASRLAVRLGVRVIAVDTAVWRTPAAELLAADVKVASDGTPRPDLGKLGTWTVNEPDGTTRNLTAEDNVRIPVPATINIADLVPLLRQDMIQGDGPIYVDTTTGGAGEVQNGAVIIRSATPGTPPKVLEVGAGLRDTHYLPSYDDAMAAIKLAPKTSPVSGDDEPIYVETTRTDLMQAGRYELDATQPAPDAIHAAAATLNITTAGEGTRIREVSRAIELHQGVLDDFVPVNGEMDAVMINNNFGYTIDVGKLGEALREGGLLVVQGRYQDDGGTSRPNRFYKPFWDDMQQELQAPGSKLPPGYELMSADSWTSPMLSTDLAGNLDPGPKPAQVIGGPFNSADVADRPLRWPDSRIVIRKIPVDAYPGGLRDGPDPSVSQRQPATSGQLTELEAEPGQEPGSILNALQVELIREDEPGYGSGFEHGSAGSASEPRSEHAEDLNPAHPSELPVTDENLARAGHGSLDGKVRTDERGVRLAGQQDEIMAPDMAPIQVRHPDAFVVEIHGDDGLLYVDGQPIAVDDPEFTRVLEAAGWRPGQPIILGSCEADPVAELLAAKFPGTDVVATDALVWRDKNGNLIAASEDHAPDGKAIPKLVQDQNGNWTGDGKWYLHRAGTEAVELRADHPLHPTVPEAINPKAEFFELAAHGVVPRVVTSDEIEGEYGILEHNQKMFQAMSDRYKLIFDVRPSNSDSADWLRQGGVPKPEAIKAKTINELDARLAPYGMRATLRRMIGAVGLFEPVAPVREPGESAASWAAVQNRYQQRLDEYHELKPKLDHLEEEGKFKVRSGVVYPFDPVASREATGDYPTIYVDQNGQAFAYDWAANPVTPVDDLPPVGRYGPPVAGDHDIFNIRDPAGRPLAEVVEFRDTETSARTRMFVFRDADGSLLDIRQDPQLDVWYEKLVNEAARGPDQIRDIPYEAGELLWRGMGVRHGAHMQWTPKNAFEQQIYDKIVNSHQQGGEPLVRFQPGKPPMLVWADTPV